MSANQPTFVPLRRGDTVGVVAPAGAVTRSRLEAGLRVLRRMGFRPEPGEHVLARHRYLAGSDAQRLDDLNIMFRRPDIRAVWFARGGYGTTRLLGGVAWSALRRHPKLLIGYSDLTALFAGAVRRSGLVCLYGPVVSELGDPATFHGPSLRGALAGRPSVIRFRAGQVLRHGRARGRLVGGNLCVLSHLWGTRFAADLDGGVLFLEDVGEASYRLDRMLTQLVMTGALRRVRGIVFGSFDGVSGPAGAVEELIRELLLPLGVPLVVGLPAGHLPAKRTLPLGGRVELDTRSRRLRLWPTA